MSETRAQNVPTTELDLGKPRTLAFTLGAMQRIKEKTGHSVLELAAAAKDRDGSLGATMLDQIHVWIWAMMEKTDRGELSPEDVADLLHPGSLPAITEAIGSLFRQSMPESPRGAEGNGIGPAAPRPPAAPDLEVGV
jgi:hypothetical protein